MQLADIMVHVDDSEVSRHRLDLALSLASQFGAQVVGIVLLAEPFLRGATAHIPATFINEILVHAEEDTEGPLAGMRREADRRGVPFALRKEAGSLDRLPSLLARSVRNTDLVIIGQPDPLRSSSNDALLLEAAFMETGRPALMVPHGDQPAASFERVVVAWNASREAARAVHDALPILKAARDVVVLVVNPETVGSAGGAPPGGGVTEHLLRHGVPARARTVESGRRNTGEVMIDEAREVAANLLVMGGYGHSKFRESILGGATRTLLERAPIPVLLSH